MARGVIGLGLLVGLLAGPQLAHSQIGAAFGPGAVCVKYRAPRGGTGGDAKTIYASGHFNNPDVSYLDSCSIKAPPILACFSGTTVGFTPPIPGGGPTPDRGGVYCYKAKCLTKGTVVGSGKDQFGFHAGTGYSATMFCAPASASGAFLD